MMKVMKCDVLINLGSRSAKQSVTKVMAALENAGFEVRRRYEITKSTSLSSAISSIRDDSPGLLIIGGGDGTVSAALGQLAGQDLEVGIVPLGTTNNYARSLGITTDIDEAVEIIKQSPARPVDLGLVNDQYFSNVSSIGVSAAIARSVTPTMKRRYGRLAYAIAGLKVLVSHKSMFVKLQDIDGELSVVMETHQIIIANGRYHAGREIAQDAAIDNGQLLIFALGGGSKVSFLRHMVDFYFGKRRQIRHSSYFVGRHIRVSTDSSQLLEVDGEVTDATPVVASVARAALRVRF